MLDVPFALARIHDLPDGLIQLLHDLSRRGSDPAKIAREHLSSDDAWRIEVESFEQADILAEIALATGVRQYLKDAFISGDLVRYWRYTLSCAITCAELSKCTGQNTPLAFSCGLLHDLGRLALMTGYPAQYANLFAVTELAFSRHENVNISAQERLLFGFDRFQTGEWLVEKWKLPEFFKGIAGKFQTVQNDAGFDLTGLTRAGCSIAFAFGYGLMLGAPKRPIEELTVGLPQEIIDCFGEDLSGLKTAVDETLERWSKLLL